MEDFFYFTKSEISLRDIVKAADEFNYRCEFVKATDISLNIYIDENIYYQFSEINKDEGDWNSFEPEDMAKVDQYSPCSSFIISYHLNALEMLPSILKLLLERYDGWIGSDGPEFEPIFRLDNLHSLPDLTKISHQALSNETNCKLGKI